MLGEPRRSDPPHNQEPGTDPLEIRHGHQAPGTHSLQLIKQQSEVRSHGVTLLRPLSYLPLGRGGLHMVVGT